MVYVHLSSRFELQADPSRPSRSRIRGDRELSATVGNIASPASRLAGPAIRSRLSSEGATHLFRALLGHSAHQLPKLPRAHHNLAKIANWQVRWGSWCRRVTLDGA